MMEQRPQLYADLPREVVQDPKAVLAIANASKPPKTGGGAPDVPKMTFAQAERYILEAVGNWDPLTGELDVNEPYRYGLDANDVIKLTQTLQAGGTVPDFEAMASRGRQTTPGFNYLEPGLGIGGVEPPPYRGPFRPEDMPPPSAESFEIEPPPEADEFPDEEQKREDETLDEYVLRLKSIGLDIPTIVERLKFQKLWQGNAPGT
jgi:hypothetical protein